MSPVKIKAKAKKGKKKRDQQEYSAEFTFEEERPKTKRKSWSIHDLVSIRAQTENQQRVLDLFYQDKHLALTGCAGTGKTFLASYLACNSVLDPHCEISRIIIVRSAVQSRDVGFLPGTLEEKLAQYEIPYRDTFAYLLRRPSSYDDMKEAGLVEFVSTSFLRGLTFDNAFIIFDECQNAEFRELNTVLTRMGRNSRVIMIGDTAQTDLDKRKYQSGLMQFLDVAQTMDCFGMIDFQIPDIVRSGFAREWIQACYNKGIV